LDDKLQRMGVIFDYRQFFAVESSFYIVSIGENNLCFGYETLKIYFGTWVQKLSVGIYCILLDKHTQFAICVNREEKGDFYKCFVMN